MAAHKVVHMITVWDALMSAAGAMNVPGFVCAAIVPWRAVVGIFSSSGNLMVVHMIAMHVVQVPIVKIVGVALVLHGGVAAIGAMLVRVTFVLRTGGSHACLHFVRLLIAD